MTQIALNIAVIVASHEPLILYRRQHRKPFALPPQAQGIDVGWFFRDIVDPRR
jgi:hypothetical protein